MRLWRLMSPLSIYVTLWKASTRASRGGGGQLQGVFLFRGTLPRLAHPRKTVTREARDSQVLPSPSGQNVILCTGAGAEKRRPRHRHHRAAVDGVESDALLSEAHAIPLRMSWTEHVLLLGPGLWSGRTKEPNCLLVNIDRDTRNL